MQSTDHTHFYSGPNARSADREDSLSPDTTFQPETHMFLPDKISGKPNNSGYFAADQRGIPYKKWNDVSFCVKSAGKKETKAGALKSTG